MTLVEEELSCIVRPNAHTKKKKKKGCPLAAYCYGIYDAVLQGRCFAPEMTILLDGDPTD